MSALEQPQHQEQEIWIDTSIDGTEKAIIKLNPDVQGFAANGTRYFIETADLTMARWEQKQQMDIAFGFGISYSELYKKILEAFEAGNKNKMADCFFMLGNLLQSIVHIEENKIPAVELCTLFINAEGEDRREYDPLVMEKKKNDWRKAGIGMSFFLRHAIYSTPGLPALLKEAFQSISEKVPPFNTVSNTSRAS